MKYVIVEVIPTSSNKTTGDIAQLSALKINNLNLVDRFDYRLNEDKVKIPDLLDIISYDKDSFKYVDSTSTILSEFKKWIEDYKLLIIDNPYTLSYLEDIESKESIFKHLDLEYSDDVIDKIIKKYKLEPSNYIVDLLYEALIYESNNK